MKLSPAVVTVFDNMIHQLPRVIVVILVMVSFCSLARAEEGEEDQLLKIHVLTMGQGEELFTRFGHIGLMVENTEYRTKKVYNFGTFDFADPDLRVRYVRGFLNYWLSIGSYIRTVRRYRDFDREMVVRTLDLTQEQAAEIEHRLEVNALPENREYAYRHYLDNCCTRIRDLLDDVTGGLLSQGRDQEPTGRTFRDWTKRALTGLPVMSTLILFSLGPAIDQPITRYDEQFLPIVVAEDLDDIRFGPEKRPFVIKKRTVVERQGPDVTKMIPTSDIVVIAVFFGLFIIGLGLPNALGKRRVAARLLGFGLFVHGLITGLGGLVLVLYWTATTHYDTHYNENLLIMPVLHLWLIGPALKLLFTARLKERTTRALAWYLIATLGLIALDVLLKIGPFIQSNWGLIVFVALCNTAALAAFHRTGLLKKLRQT